MCEACADGGGDKVAERDAHVVEGDHAAAVLGWGEFADCMYISIVER